MKPGLHYVKLVLLLLLASCTSKAPTLNEYTVARKTISQRVLVSGQVAPIRKAAIQPAFNGYVQKLYVKVGDHVLEGTPLISISQSIKATGEETHPLRSPISGVVTQVLKTEGQAVAPSRDDSTLLTVEDTREMLLLCNVPELEISKLRIGLAAEVRIQAASEKVIPARIDSLALSATEKKDYSRNSGTADFAVRIRLEGPLEQVHAGMSGIAEIVASERTKALAVPHEYIRKHGDKFEVLLKGTGPTLVTLGLRSEQESEILSGLKEGDILQLFDLVSGEKAK